MIMSNEKNHISENAFVGESVKFGNNVKVWNMAYVGNNTKVGDNVMIGSLAHIDYDVKIGSNCKIEGLVYIAPKCIIGNNVFIGPSATLTNDPYPPSTKLAGVVVEDNVIIGARSVIKAGVTIGKNSVVAMGSIVTKDVPFDSVVLGTPAKIVYTRAEYDAKMKDWEGSSKY